MAMTTAGLKAAIISELNAIAPTVSAANGDSGATWRDAFASAVANAVINYLKANAEVAHPGGQSVAHAMGPGVAQPFTIPAGSVK